MALTVLSVTFSREEEVGVTPASESALSSASVDCITCTACSVEGFRSRAKKEHLFNDVGLQDFFFI